MPYEQNLVLFEALKYERSWTLEGYRQFGGYQAGGKRCAAAAAQRFPPA